MLLPMLAAASVVVVVVVVAVAVGVAVTLVVVVVVVVVVVAAAVVVVAAVAAAVVVVVAVVVVAGLMSAYDVVMLNAPSTHPRLTEAKHGIARIPTIVACHLLFQSVHPHCFILLHLFEFLQYVHLLVQVRFQLLSQASSLAINQ